MSATSWMQEFYSNPDPNLKVLTKWIGLSKKNIAKHGGEKLGYIVRFDSFVFKASSSSCYFCQDTKNKNKLILCENCPGLLMTGRECDYAWFIWVNRDFNFLMKQWIIETLIGLKYEEKKILKLHMKLI